MSAPLDRAGATMVLALTGALLLGATASCSSASAASRADEQPDTELQLGQEVFDELKGKGVIVASSPLYDVLEPLVARITRAAQPRPLAGDEQLGLPGRYAGADEVLEELLLGGDADRASPAKLFKRSDAAVPSPKARSSRQGRRDRFASSGSPGARWGHG